jgi:hypothetical protein
MKTGTAIVAIPSRTFAPASQAMTTIAKRHTMRRLTGRWHQCQRVCPGGTC